MCWGVQLLIGSEANVGCPSMFGFLICFGVVGGRLQCRVFRSQFWVLVGRWRDTVGMGEVCGGVLWWSRRFCVLLEWCHRSSAWCFLLLREGL